MERNSVLLLIGVHCQEVLHHAVSDRLRDPGRGHDHGSASQQPKAAGEAHYSARDWDLCQASTQEPGAQVWLCKYILEALLDLLNKNHHELQKKFILDKGLHVTLITDSVQPKSI